MEKILIIEDDKEIALLESEYLKMSGFDVETVYDGLNAAETAINGEYSLILLDVMLPNKSGYEICKEIRDKIDIPILMVTAKSEQMDKICGLGIGADDYISKPFDPAELVARVRANINQYNRLKNKEVNQNETVIQNIRLNTESHRVFKNDTEIKLSNREFELLSFLFLNPDIVFSKEQLFEKIWGFDYIGDSATVMVHINRIREKIEDNPQKPKLIETVWGAGYRLNS